LPKSLVIVESPAKAKTISKFLGRNYTVKASMGHVRDLPRSQFGVDVNNGFEPKYITIRGKGPVLKELRDAAKKANRILLATDPDREGEAIAWHLAEALKINNDNCRIEFREVTKDAVKDSVKQPKEISDNLVAAQQARRILDRLVGYNLSPLLWAKVKRGLSAGRVQSVAVRIICERQKEIDAFVPEEYWTITAHLANTAKEKFEAKLLHYKNKKVELKDKEQTDAILADLKGKPWHVDAVRKKQRRRNPAPPFTTSTLQQEAARKLNFTAKKTMRVAQQLYEGLDVGEEGTTGLITYMRTDATRVSPTAIDEARRQIADAFGQDYLPSKPRQYQSKSGAQEAHEAVRPTSALRTPSGMKPHLSRDQLRLYRLIWERFVASQMAAAIMDSVSVDIKVGDYLFRATGSSIRFPGFLKLYEEGQDDVKEQEGILPELAEGERLTRRKVEPKQHFTQPPPRYSEAMLVRTLEEKGIGRPSTYAPIIDTILRRGYVVLEEKRFMPTELGIIVVDLLKEHFSQLMDVGFTAELEQKLDQVEEGQASWKGVIREFYSSFAKDLEKAHEHLEKIEIEDEESDVPCEQCGRMMVIKWGRYGKFLACPAYPECKNTKPILEEIGVPCPKCTDGQIVQRKSRKGRTFYGCSNYPDCDFVSWNKPVDEACKHCGELLVIKRQGQTPTCATKGCPGGNRS